MQASQHCNPDGNNVRNLGTRLNCRQPHERKSSESVAINMTSRKVVAQDDHNRCCGGRWWFVRDICGIICAIMTWGLVLYAEYVVIFIILVPGPYVYYSVANFVIYQGIVFLAVFSHLRAMLTDPGVVPRGTATKEAIQQLGIKEGMVVYKCPKCCSIKPERAHHCSVCQRCIRKMDHHCPWVNNCVGENNQKYFILFTLYIAVMSTYSFFLAVSHFIMCLNSEWKKCNTYSPPATIVFLLLLIFEALLFAIFTMVMFGTQLQAIWTDETGIEQLKKEAVRWKKHSAWRSVRATFGRFSLAWFSPFTSSFSNGRVEGLLYSV